MVGRVATEPSGDLRDMVSQPITAAAIRLGEDADLMARFDDWIVKLGGAVADTVGNEVSDMIETTVLSWDVAESTRRVELGVGPDLQIIRINGTVVGGLVGLLIHSVTEMLS